MCRLIPLEREALRSALDVDGTGGIDFEEFEGWWDSTPLTPNNHWMRLLLRDKTARVLDGRASPAGDVSPLGKPIRRGGIFPHRQESICTTEPISS